MDGFAASLRHLESLEELSGGESLLHRCSATAKIVFTFVYIAAVVSFPAYGRLGLLWFFLYPAAAVRTARLPCRLLFRRTAAALPFVCFAGAANLFLDKVPVEITGGLTVSGGVLSFAVLLVKAFLSVSAVLILAATTPPDVLAGGLRRLHVPCILILQLLLTWRYLGVLTGEAGTIAAAYRMRAPQSRGIRWNDWPALAGALLLRSLDRAERIYRAMQCRLFDPRTVSPAAAKTPAREKAVFLFLSLLCVLARFPGLFKTLPF